MANERTDAKNHGVVHCKWVSCMICELWLNNAVLDQRTVVDFGGGRSWGTRAYDKLPRNQLGLSPDLFGPVAIVSASLQFKY